MMRTIYKASFVVLTAAVLAAPSVFAQDVPVMTADRIAFAEKLRARGDLARAIEEYTVLAKDDSAPKEQVLFRLGTCCDEAGRKNEALKIFNHLLKTFPNGAYATRAELCRAKLLPFGERLAVLKRLASTGVEDEIKAAAIFELGEAYRTSDPKEAVVAYERVVGEYPNDHHVDYARLRLAVLLSASDNKQDQRRAMSYANECTLSKNQSIAESALLVSGGLCARDGRADSAIVLYNRFLARYPSSANRIEAKIGIAQAYIAKERYNEALEALSGTSVQERKLKAFALSRLARFNEALAIYDELLAALPDGEERNHVWYERVRVLDSKGDNEGVLAALAKRETLPDFCAGDVCWIGGNAARAVTNMPLAVEYMRRSAASESGIAPEAAYMLAWLLYQSGAKADAAVEWRKMAVKWSDNSAAAKALLAAGNAEAAKGDSAGAIRDWTRLLEKYPSSKEAPEALYLRAREELRNKNYRAAALSIDEYLKRFSTDSLYSRKAEALYFRGFCANALGEIPEAEAFFRQALEAEPSPDFAREALLSLGTLLRKEGREKEAVAVFAKLIDTSAVERLSPDKLAWIADSMLTNGERVKAGKVATVLRKRNADDAWNQVAQAIIGTVHFENGELDAARVAFREALSFPAKTVYGVQAALRLGRMETGSGNHDEAKRLLASAVEHSGSDELLPLRAEAYFALGENERARKNLKGALEYFMLVGTLYDDEKLTPMALSKAIEILRGLSRNEEADKFAAELSARYPKSGLTGKEVSE